MKFRNYNDFIRDEIEKDLAKVDSLAKSIVECLFIKCRFRENYQQGRSDNFNDYTYTYIFTPNEYVDYIIRSVFPKSININSRAIYIVEKEAEYTNAKSFTEEAKKRIAYYLTIEYIQNGRESLVYIESNLLKSVQTLIHINERRYSLDKRAIELDLIDYIKKCEEQVRDLSTYNFNEETKVGEVISEVTLSNLKQAINTVNQLVRELLRA